MKILGLSCSPRKSGNTDILITEAVKGVTAEGVETEFFSVAGKDIKPCDGCGACRKTGVCNVKDDMQSLYEKLVEADGIIYGTPVYFHGMSAQAKAIIDRTLALRYPAIQLSGKVGGVIATAGRLGIIDVLKSFYFYFAFNHMIPADYVISHVAGKAVIDDDLTVKTAFELGREMAQMVKQKFEFPAEFARGLTPYVTEKYKL